MSLTATAIVLGIVEGLTEFLPVSSTGHLILATRLLGYDPGPWEVFNIVIQLPAILAVVVLYWRTFLAVGTGALKGQQAAIRFVTNIVVAFIPAAILGVLLKKRIDALLENPSVVAWALIIGGLAIILIERVEKQGAYTPIGEVSVPKSFGIGIIQCIAMIPGVSRSGATIMGGLSMGLNRRTAAEFSFFLAVPTMLGATVKQLWDNRHELAGGHTLIGAREIAVGSVVSFVVALVVIRLFVGYIGKHGFTPFAVYRIIAGIVALVWMHGF